MIYRVDNRQDPERRTSDILNNAIGRFKEIKLQPRGVSPRVEESGFLISPMGIGEHGTAAHTTLTWEAERGLRRSPSSGGYQIDRVSTSGICGWNRECGAGLVKDLLQHRKIIEIDVTVKIEIERHHANGQRAT